MTPAGSMAVAAGWLWAAAALLPSHAEAEPWTRHYIASLPDSAFAVVETAPDGSKLRHLPHHDRSGRLDPAHLRNATSRQGQVKWRDRRNAVTAREHLAGHLQDLRSPKAPPHDVTGEPPR